MSRFAGLEHLLIKKVHIVEHTFCIVKVSSNRHVSQDVTLPDNYFLGATAFAQPRRAHIAIYNWDVAVDVSPVLTPGVAFELRNAQDFWAEPVLVGTHTGSPLVVPMQALPAVWR